MIKYITRNKESLFLLLVEVLLFILGSLSLADDILFTISKKESYAEVIKVEKLKLPDPYRITLRYYNEYENKRIISHIDDIDGIYGKTLPVPNEHILIYYRSYFPKEVYIVNYKHPNSGNMILISAFLIIMFFAALFSWKKLTPNDISS